MATERKFPHSNRLKRRSEEISDSASYHVHPEQVTNVETAEKYVKTEMRHCVFVNRLEFIDTVFNKCIASCAAMRPIDHGFDPTIRAYDSISKTVCDPWKIPREFLEPGASKSRTWPKVQWVVEMPSDHLDSGDKREDFVLFSALSLNRAEVVKGRAGRIWLARKRSELEGEHPETSKIFVFKDNWHDVRRVTEGAMYEAEGDIDGVAKLYSYETVQIEEEDDSTSNARCGIEVPSDTKPMVLRKIRYPSKEKVEEIFKKSMQRHSDVLPADFEKLRPWLDILEEEDDPHPVYHREHHRLLLRSYGHPITDFVDRDELVVVFEDTVNGHRILVKSICIETRAGTAAFMSVELLIGEPMFEELEDPDWATINARCDEYLLPATTPVEVVPEPADIIYHQPVHDLESFFWLLCWICVTREGPSTRRDLDIKNKEHRPVIRIIHQLFEEESMTILGSNKRKVFKLYDTFETTVIDNFTPYFRPFGSLVSKLHAVLFRAYSSRNFDGLHDQFIEKIKEFRAVLKTLKLTPNERQKAMVEKAKRTRLLHRYAIEPEVPVKDGGKDGEGHPQQVVRAEILESPSHRASINKKDCPLDALPLPLSEM
ncbi:hypothetical protein ABKN59_011329 [Abortiporus biennis]